MMYTGHMLRKELVMSGGEAPTHTTKQRAHSGGSTECQKHSGFSKKYLFIYHFLKKDFIYLFMIDIERERGRDTGRGRSRSMQGARSWDSRITPWGEGRR